MSDHYDLTTDRGKISLAEAVSRFANAEEGGIVVVGMDTKRIRAGELIKSVKPVPIDTATARRYRQVIENRIFPFPTAFNIKTVEITSGNGLVVISVPPQEEELKPFLVHGAIVSGRVEGAYISIVRRSGEDSIPTIAQQIHSMLAAVANSCAAATYSQHEPERLISIRNNRGTRHRRSLPPPVDNQMTSGGTGFRKLRPIRTTRHTRAAHLRSTVSRPG